MKFHILSYLLSIFFKCRKFSAKNSEKFSPENYKLVQKTMLNEQQTKPSRLIFYLRSKPCILSCTHPYVIRFKYEPKVYQPHLCNTQLQYEVSPNCYSMYQGLSQAVHIEHSQFILTWRSTALICINPSAVSKRQVIGESSHGFRIINYFPIE